MLGHMPTLRAARQYITKGKAPIPQTTFSNNLMQRIDINIKEL
jgi:hypothetical protein